MVGAGLHPTLGLHHGNAFNACALADDIMEPFRPIIDATVKGCLEEDATAELSPARKRMLALTLYRDVASEAGMTPMTTMLARLAQSLVEVYAGERRSLELPGLLTVEALRALSREPGGTQEAQ